MSSIWLLRSAGLVYYTRFGTLGDIILLACSSVISLGLLNVVHLVALYRWSLTQLAAATALGFAFFNVFRRKQVTTSLPASTGPGRPLLFPCQTTHTRLSPKKHSFAYSYLMVGVPVDWAGAAGNMISVGEDGHGRSAWYRISPSDYLSRGKGHVGLRGKLDDYLSSQGVEPSRYPFAYLVTAAKFLGYHFNPVSFWYLYSSEKRLVAIVLEVNNTFDERRMYLLTWDSATGENLLDDGSKFAEPPVAPLKKTWVKDFHVSPFNSRKGTYSLIAFDPFAPRREVDGPINNTINLISSKDQAKLVARIVSSEAALDPTQMGWAQEFTFLLRWWWVGFVTFPRIVKEAGLLFFKRHLHVWYRPEPLKESIGRHATEAESQLESIFRRYLRHLVAQSSAALAVQYVPSGVSEAADEQMLTPAAQADPSQADQLIFKVLTPAFYSRFVHYAHDLEAVFCELNESCTIWLSSPHLLPKLVIKKFPSPLSTANYLDYGYFTAIKNLRQRPERIHRPLTSIELAPASDARDIRGFRLSAMDGYVLAHEDDECRRRYRHLVLKIFIADYVAWGSLELFWFEVLLLRVLLSWIFVQSWQRPPIGLQ